MSGIKGKSGAPGLPKNHKVGRNKIKEEDKVKKRSSTIMILKETKEEFRNLKITIKSKNDDEKLKTLIKLAKEEEIVESKEEKMVKVISVVNNKGGVGKTTMSVNLAGELQKKGSKVLYIDLDKQGNGTSNFKIDKTELKRTIVQFIKSSLREYMGIDIGSIIQKTEIGVDVIPANLEMEFVEYEIMAIPIDREYMLRKAIEKIKDKYEYIIIDCPPSLGILTQNALVASDYVIVPTQAESASLEGIDGVAAAYNAMKKYNTKLSLLGILLTMTNSRTNLHEKAKKYVEEVFGNALYSSEIRRSIKVAEAHDEGKLVCDYISPSESEVVNDIKSFVEETIERINKNGAN